MPPSRELFRIGYEPNVWALPDWKYISRIDGAFPNRYDDPLGEYRVLYAGSQRLACFMEKLARFRIASEVAAGLPEIEDPDKKEKEYPVGTVSRRLFEPLRLGRATLNIPEHRCANIASSEWIARLRPVLLPHFSALGIKDFDGSSLLLTSPRRLTQIISRYVYEEGFLGIRYPSKHGLELDNWAFLNCVPVIDPGMERIRLDDPDLQQALKLHALKLGD